MRIMLIHNHFLVREGMKMLVNSNSAMELAGDYESAENALKHTVGAVDVIVFNFREPVNGLPALKELQSAFPAAKFLSISYMPSKFELSGALNSGVTSFLLPECDGEEILDAIQATAASEQFFCGKILSQVVQGQDEASPPSEYVCDGIRISAREGEIIRLVAEGLTNKEIADRLFLSTHTVTTHRKNIMAKLGVNNTAGLVLYAIRNNIVTPNHFLFSGN